MAEISFKERVRQEMINASKEYKAIYVDYEYLVCSEAFVRRDYYIIDAKEDHFRHLTGVHSQISANRFFDKCIQETLTENDFDFMKDNQNEREVIGTVRRKIKVLPNMMHLFKDGVQAEEDFVKNNVQCSFATADNTCTLCFCNFNKSVPKSLIKGNGLTNPKPVELVLRKRSGDRFFHEIVLGNEDILHKYRHKIEELLDGNLY